MPAAGDALERWVLPAVMLVSAAAIGYEILLMRVLSIVHWHHFAYMIISLALLGYGASGTFVALARRALTGSFRRSFCLSALLFAVTAVGAFILGQRVPFNALEIVWDPRQFLHLATIYFVFFVPFFFAATCIGLAFTGARKLITQIYFFDLLGAGLGALGLVLSLFVLSPQDAARAIAATGLLAASIAAFGAPSRRYRLLAIPALAFALLFTALPERWLEFRISPYKGLEQALEVIDTRVVAERSGPLGLVSVVESPAIPFRHAPGLSFTTRYEPPEQLAIFTDGDGMSTMTRFDGDFLSLRYMDDVAQALPYRLVEKPRVLVLGAGGGTDVLFALYHGASSVDAVELNRQIAGLVEADFAEFTGHLYQHEKVEVHIAEARGFVARSKNSFDIIQVSLLDSFAASGAGVQSLGESYVYTVEALQQYLRHLSPGGLLAITRWIKLPPRDNLKLVATARQALEREGFDQPGQRISIIRSWNTSTLLVRNGTFSRSDIDTIRTFARKRSFDLAYYPSMPAEEANRFNVLPEPWLYEGSLQLLGESPETYIDRYKFHIEPATDDKPYFFHFFKWSAFEEMLALRAQGGAGLIEWGYLVLVGTLVQAILAGAVLILLPLSVITPGWPRGTGRWMGGYFLLLGLAFLLVEIAFIQKFILFLSHPLYSVAVVLSSFLLFAGLGSACSTGLAHRAQAWRRSPLPLVIGAIVAIALLYLLLLPMMFQVFAGIGDPLKVALSIVLIAPLAFFMGMPFPLGLARVAEEAADFIPWAWGINGFASVVSASLAAVLAIELGFGAVVLLALLLYAAAGLVIRYWPITRHSR